MGRARLGWRQRLVGGIILVLTVASSAEAAKVVVGKPAPDFKAVTFDGQKVSLEAYKGQVLIINFWATWCGPCRKELPLLDAAPPSASAEAVKSPDNLPD